MKSYVNISHPAIIGIRDFFLSDIDPQGNCNFNIVMDLCTGGDLDEFLKRQSKHLSSEV